MKKLHQFFIPTLLLLSSCVSSTDRAMGINGAEMQALKENYYWKQEYAVPSFAPGELEKLMDHSTDPSLDGEYGESQSSALAVALATVGDDVFAGTLATRSREVQVAVISRIRYMWTHYQLHHPRTQAIAAAFEEGESDPGE